MARDQSKSNSGQNQEDGRWNPETNRKHSDGRDYDEEQNEELKRGNHTCAVCPIKSPATRSANR